MGVVFPFSFVFLCLLAISQGLPENSPQQSAILGDPLSSFVIGGEDASLGEIPYQIEIRVAGQHYCGGSLISVNGTQLTLTAAHCLDTVTPENLTIYAGEIKLSKVSGFEQVRNVSKFIIHEDWDFWKLTLEDDIALIALDKPFDLNENISTISLPPKWHDPTGLLAMASGWGDTDRDFDSKADHLQKVTLPIISDEVCLKQYESQIIKPRQKMVCAGSVTEDGKGVCFGDSGGPLVPKNESYVVGIVSWGGTCGTAQFPGVFTEVTHYIDWIEENGAKLADDK